MKRIETQVDLPAVPTVVWEQLVDTAAMGSWNPFITSMSGVLAVGERLRVRVAPVGGRPMTFKPRVTVVEPGQRLEWLGTMGIPGLFDGRHSFTLTPIGDGGTRLVQAEEFSGALVTMAGEMLAKTEAGFHAMNAALLARLEKDQSASNDCSGTLTTWRQIRVVGLATCTGEHPQGALLRLRAPKGTTGDHAARKLSGSVSKP